MKYYKIRDLTQLKFELTLKAIYGKRIYHGYSVSRLKNECGKLIKTIRKAIDLNIETDNFHKSRFDLALNDLELSLKDKDFEIGYILGLIKIIFLLLGDFPSNWNVKKTNKEWHFILSSCRKIIYTQSKYQKITTILKSHQYPPFSDQLSKDDLIRNYHKEYGFGADLNDRFLNWYKKKYPSNYLKLF